MSLGLGAACFVGSAATVNAVLGAQLLQKGSHVVE